MPNASNLFVFFIIHLHSAQKTIRDAVLTRAQPGNVRIPSPGEVGNRFGFNAASLLFPELSLARRLEVCERKIIKGKHLQEGKAISGPERHANKKKSIPRILQVVGNSYKTFKWQ